MKTTTNRIAVTWRRSAPGFKVDVGGYPFEQTYGELKWATFDDLRKYCEESGIVAEVTPCEESGTKFYYGNGGYRFRHDQMFLVPGVEVAQ